MGYVGRGLNQDGGQYRKLDDISSTFNGSNTSFSLAVSNVAVTPTAQNLLISINGVIQEPGSAFSMNGSTITFTEAPAGDSTFFGVLMGEASFIAHDTVGANEMGVTAGTVKASRGVVVDSSKNISGFNKIEIANSGSTDDALLITSTEDGSTASPVITLKRNSGSPADSDYIGQVKFKGENDNDQDIVYAKVTGKIQDASDGSEDGLIEFANKKAGSNVITARLRSDSFQLLNSTNFSVAGTSTMTGNVTLGGNISGSSSSTGSVGRLQTNQTNSSFGGNILTVEGTTNVNQDLTSDASPTFAGGTITGDFSVGGTLTAQEIHTEFESASILFTSGSTKFGDTSNDTHSMTGSLLVSGSITMADGDLSVTDDVVFGATAIVETGLNLESGTFTIKNATGDSNGLKISQGGSDASNILNHYNGTLNLGVANSVDMTLKSGRVGIGDTSPGSPLDVKSGEAANTANFNSTSGATNITFESNGSLIGQMEFSGPGPSAIVTRTSASLALGSNNVRTLYITDDDRVGIGVASPAYTFDLASGDAIVSQFTGTSGETILSLDNTSTNGDKWYLISGGSGGSFSGGKFGIYNADTTTAVATFTNDGKVGIGTTSPDNLLHIKTTGSTPSIELEQDAGTSYKGLIKLAGNDLEVRGSSGTIEFFTGNNDGDSSTERMRITSGGFVGIQTVDNSGDYTAQTISAPLHVLQKTASQAYGLVVQGNSNSQGGRIGIGEADSNFGTRANVIDIGFDSSTDFIYSRTGKDFIFGVNSAEKLRIKSTGQIETTYGDSSYNLYINGLASSATKGILMAVGPSSGTVDQMLFRDGNSHNCGAITSDASANTTAYGTSSDYRLKENEVIISDGIERIKKLKPYRFNFISAPDQIQDGFFAHELAEHIPEAVTGEKDAMEDGEIKSQNVDYGKITPLLVGALKEAITKIETLETKVETLEGK